MKASSFRFPKKGIVAVDTETTGLEVWHGDEPFAFSFCDEEGNTACFEWPVDPWTRVVIPNQSELDAIGEFLENEKVDKVFHNAKFDVRIIENAFGITTRGGIHDTMFMAHACNSLESSYGLKELCVKYLGLDASEQDLLKKAAIRARREAKKQGWTLGGRWKVANNGEWKYEAEIPADYWMPRAVDPEDRHCALYAIADVEYTMLLRAFFKAAFEDLGVEHVYERERELWHVTYNMETRGVRIALDRVDEGIETLRAERKRNYDLVTKAGSKVVENFNLEAGAHIRKLAYNDQSRGGLGLKCTRYTEKGTPQTNVDALIPHLDNPVIEALFKFRACKKGLVDYFQKYHVLRVPDPLNESGWCLHPDFNQVGPATGRYSCRNPNLQNVANALTTRSPMPIQARTPFGPRPGYRWYCIDYSQLEVRVFADVSREPAMLQALVDGEDLHTACTNKAWGGEGNLAALRAASHALELDGTGDGSAVKELWEAFGLNATNVRKLKSAERDAIADQWLTEFDYDIVDAEKSIGKKTSRAKAKMILFAKVFGGGPNAIKDLLNCTYEEAQQFLWDYDTAFPKIVDYINELSRKARAEGCIVNRFGRRLTVNPDKAYRAVNYMVQGSAADLLKISMIRCAEYLKETGLDAHLVMTIHDELVFEFRRIHARKEVLRNLCRIMEDHQGAFGVETPVEVDNVIESWNEKKGVEL